MGGRRPGRPPSGRAHRRKRLVHPGPRGGGVLEGTRRVVALAFREWSRERPRRDRDFAARTRLPGGRPRACAALLRFRDRLAVLKLQAVPVFVDAGPSGLVSLEKAREYNVYLRRNLPLAGPEGLAAIRIFSVPPGARPPRIEPGPGDALWRGYLTGEYLTGDWGGAETVWHHRIFADRSLKAYMMRASELRAWPCSRAGCSGRGPSGWASMNPTPRCSPSRR